MRFLVLLGLALTLAGCATPNGGGSSAPQDVQFECKERALKMTPTYNGRDPNYILLRQYYQECLQMKGY